MNLNAWTKIKIIFIATLVIEFIIMLALEKYLEFYTTEYQLFGVLIMDVITLVLIIFLVLVNEEKKDNKKEKKKWMEEISEDFASGEITRYGDKKEGGLKIEGNEIDYDFKYNEKEIELTTINKITSRYKRHTLTEKEKKHVEEFLFPHKKEKKVIRVIQSRR